MNRQIRFVSAFLVLAMATLACALPLGAAPTSSPDSVSTVVALTMQALTPANNDVPTLDAGPSNSLLPHTLYFLNNDSAGLSQIFRMERDGTTITQVTFEPAAVGNYGVSPVDGSVAYMMNNQLLLVNADGSGRRLIVDGGTVDQNNPFVDRMSNPVFSPDGQTLAYGHKGLNFYALATGVSNRVIEDQVEDSGGGFLFPKELYAPEKYSPDGSKLLITLGYYEGASSAIYDPDSKALVRLTGAEGALICCDQTQWSADGTSFYSANSAIGMFNSGLWKVDAATGAVTTLISSNYESAMFNYASKPYLAPDGQLYYFFHSTDQEYNMRTPLQLVRSAPDGVTGRTVINNEIFDTMNEALWSPDASFVITADAPVADVYQGGVASIAYTDGRPGVRLADYVLQMKWGP